MNGFASNDSPPRGRADAFYDWGIRSCELLVLFSVFYFASIKTETWPSQSLLFFLVSRSEGIWLHRSGHIGGATKASNCAGPPRSP